MMYMVIAAVGSVKYLTAVSAESACAAEHVLLDEGIAVPAPAPMGTYTCQAALAFNRDDIRTEFFADEALDAQPIGLMDLIDLIQRLNRIVEDYRQAERAYLSAREELQKTESKRDAALAALRINFPE